VKWIRTIYQIYHWKNEQHTIQHFMLLVFFNFARFCKNCKICQSLKNVLID
jgi:hypothetical protein